MNTSYGDPRGFMRLVEGRTEPLRPFTVFNYGIYYWMGTEESEIGGVKSDREWPVWLMNIRV